MGISKMGLRLLCFLISLLCVLLLVQPASAEHGTDLTTVGVCTADVYYAPSEKSEIIGQVLHGTRLEVLERDGRFLGVDCYGMTGYIPEEKVRWDDQGECYANCQTPAEQKELFFRYRAAGAQELRERIVEMSRACLGVPYVYGGASPCGFDCSGFAFYLFGKQGITLNRCADDQLRNGLIVAREELEKGDLVFFTTYGSWAASHVGIYIGDGMVIHAVSGGIACSSLDEEYWESRYVGARRVIDVTLATPMTAESGFSGAASPEKVCVSLNMIK